MSEADSRTPRWMGGRIRLLVFTAGASLMALEIAGSRVLAPHFGSSLFIWGGLISVFLLALSAGYFLGGWAGDRWPDLFTLNMAVGGAGLLFLLIPHIGIPVCVALEDWGPRWGPLTAAVIVFVLPSVLLGTASPVAVRLYTKEISRSGRAAGSLYAVSTFGSLAGTFLATFLLVPLLGTPELLRAMGLILVVLPLLLQPKQLGLVFYVVPAAALTLAFLTSALPEVPLAPGGGRVYGRVIHETETPYHRIFVIEGKEGGEDVRYLQFDHYLESGIEVDEPHHSVTHYTHMFQLSSVFCPEPASALFIGGGGMVGPRVYREIYPSMERIDVVEIDPEVVRIAKEYFAFDPGEKTHITVGDGRIFLDRAERTWAVVVLDAYTAGGRVPFHLLTRQFFEKVRDRLSPEGVCLLNIIGALEGPKSKVFRSAFKTMEAVFPRVYAFPRVRPSGEGGEAADAFRADFEAYRRAPASLDAESRKEVERVRNIFIAATLDEASIDAETSKARAKRLVASGAVPERFRLVSHASSLIVDIRTEDLYVLTDDFAPVEQWETW